MTKAEMKELSTDHNSDCLGCVHFMKDCKKSGYGKAVGCKRYEEIEVLKK